MNREDFEYFYDIKRENEKLKNDVENEKKQTKAQKETVNAYNRTLTRIIDVVKDKYQFLYDLYIKPILEEERLDLEEKVKKLQKNT